MLKYRSTGQKINFREELSWFSCGSSILIELEFGMMVFVEGGKSENPEKYQ